MPTNMLATWGRKANAATVPLAVKVPSRDEEAKKLAKGEL